jgi:hypothetical protein
VADFSLDFIFKGRIFTQALFSLFDKFNKGSNDERRGFKPEVD